MNNTLIDLTCVDNTYTAHIGKCVPGQEIADVLFTVSDFA